MSTYSHQFNFNVIADTEPVRGRFVTYLMVSNDRSAYLAMWDDDQGRCGEVPVELEWNASSVQL